MQDKSIVTGTFVPIYKPKKFHRGIPDILNARQIGSLNSGSIVSEVMKSKLCHLQKTNAYDGQFYVAFRSHKTIDCRFVISYESRYFIAWFSDNCTTVNTVQKIFENRANETIPPHVVTGATMRILYVFSDSEIVHMCSADFDNEKYIFICRNSTLSSSSNYYSLVPVDGFSGHISFETTDTLRCCAWNHSKSLMIVGTKRGLIIKKLEDANFTSYNSFEFPFNDHKAVEVSDSGNVFTISEGGKLMAADLRTQMTRQIVTLGHGVSFMKSLKNNYTLITSAWNELSNVDIRMGKVVFEYPGFCNQFGKIPFTFNEDWNVLCCTGQDGVTRLWDLKQGEELASLNPSLIWRGKVHSILTVEDNVLCTDILVNHKLFCYQPL